MAYISEALRRLVAERQQYCSSSIRAIAFKNSYVTERRYDDQEASSCGLHTDHCCSSLNLSFLVMSGYSAFAFGLKRSVDSVVIEVAIVDFDAFLEVF